MVAILMCTVFVVIVMMLSVDKFVVPLLTPKPAPEIEAAKPVWYDCFVSTERIQEQRLVDGGVMDIEDMTICEDPRCPNCEPTRSARETQELAKANQDLHDARMLAVRRRAARLGNKELARAENKRLEEENRRTQMMNGPVKSYSVTEDGIKVPRPDNVPHFAKCALDYDAAHFRWRAVWTWDYGDGRTYNWQLRLTDEVFKSLEREKPVINVETYKIDTGDGKTILTAGSITADRLYSTSLAYGDFRTKEHSLGEIHFDCDCPFCEEEDIW